MRAQMLIIAVVLALSPQAYAQFQPTEQYDAPPSTFVTPTDFSMVSVTAARGNLGQWRDDQRRRIGPYRREVQARTSRLVEQDALPAVEGYFVVFEGGRALPGIVQGRWHTPSSEVGQAQHMRHLRYTRPYQICGASHETANVDIAAVAFLGHQWRPEFDALDEELRAVRAITGEELARTEPAMGYDPAPTATEFQRFYPVRALEREQEGRATLKCFVNPERTMHCGIESEDPGGWGFGEAARHIVENPRVRVPERAVHGENPVGRCIQRSVGFRLG